jgi:hypothetical protein
MKAFQTVTEWYDATGGGGFHSFRRLSWRTTFPRDSLGNIQTEPRRVVNAEAFIAGFDYDAHAIGHGFCAVTVTSGYFV